MTIYLPMRHVYSEEVFTQTVSVCYQFDKGKVKGEEKNGLYLQNSRKAG